MYNMQIKQMAEQWDDHPDVLPDKVRAARAEASCPAARAEHPA